MNNKLWLVIAAVLSVAILAMGWFIGVSPKLDEMNNANDQRTSVERQNLVYEAKLKDLEKQFAKIDELKSDLADAQRGLPPGDELSTFLGQLHQLEAASGVTLTKFQASDAERYLPAPGAVVNGAVTVNNFVAITIDLTVEGSRDQVIAFLSDLQAGERLFLVTKLTVNQEDATTPNGNGNGNGNGKSKGNGKGNGDAAPAVSYTGSITGYVYVLIDPSAPPPTPTPVGSLDTTATPSPSPSP